VLVDTSRDWFAIMVEWNGFTLSEVLYDLNESGQLNFQNCYSRTLVITGSICGLFGMMSFFCYEGSLA
jgi:hypothetical protein